VTWGSSTPGSRPRRRGWVRLLVVVVTLAVAVAGLAGLAPTARGRACPKTAPVVEIHAAHGASYVPALQGKRPLFILALGSDARPGHGIERERSDSIHLIGVNVKTHRGTILGFPRDSWVNIPGHGTGKITTAMVFGGPDLMVQTIESITGIQVDFWMLTSFWGLQNMVDAIGGLTVDVPQDMHDVYSGSNFKKGERHMNGKQALAFARDRHSLANGDLGRSANQGRLMLAALTKLRRVFDKRPADLFDWVAIGFRQMHTDLPLSTLLQLGLTATSIPVNNVDNVVVPATVGSVGTASVVFISSSASSLYADMRSDAVLG
jgi:polyisoprenyl-teichoic acid--peptidoglycan teichoic acid transferase